MGITTQQIKAYGSQSGAEGWKENCSHKQYLPSILSMNLESFQAIYQEVAEKLDTCGGISYEHICSLKPFRCFLRLAEAPGKRLLIIYNCNTPKCNTAKCNRAKCNTANCNTAKCNTAKCNTAKCNTTNCNTPNATHQHATQLQLNSTQQNATQQNVTQQNATQQNATQQNPTQQTATQQNATQQHATYIYIYIYIAFDNHQIIGLLCPYE